MKAYALLLGLAVAGPVWAAGEAPASSPRPVGWVVGTVLDVLSTPDSASGVATTVRIEVIKAKPSRKGVVDFTFPGGAVLGGDSAASLPERIRLGKVVLADADPPETALPGQHFSFAVGEPVWLAYTRGNRVWDKITVISRGFRDSIVSALTHGDPVKLTPSLSDGDRRSKNLLLELGSADLVGYRAFSPFVLEMPDAAASDSTWERVPIGQRWLRHRSFLLRPKEEVRVDEVIALAEARMSE